MSFVLATGEYGLVVRMKALEERGIDERSLFNALEDVALLGRSDDIASFGPLPGQEALFALGKQLQRIGLENGDDFFAVDLMTPAWLKLGVGLAGP